MIILLLPSITLGSPMKWLKMTVVIRDNDTTGLKLRVQLEVEESQGIGHQKTEMHVLHVLPAKILQQHLFSAHKMHFNDLILNSQE